MGTFKSLDGISDGEEIPVVPKFTTIELSISTIVERLKQVNALSDAEIRDIIFRQYNTILDYDNFLKDRKSRETVQELFKNEQFLNNLIYCVERIKLNAYQITCLNVLAFDFIITYGNTNQVVRNLLTELSMRINTDLVLPLSAIIGLEPAKYLSMVRRSSYDEVSIVRRVNTYLIKSGLEIKEQEIINIYAVLFTRISNLFTVTMLEMPDNLNQSEMVRYDEMSKAILDILDNMPSEEIMKVLSNYASSWSLFGEPNVRFSLQCLHNSYGRITKVVRILMEQGTIVP
ncbi:MAG: hypothetical protein NC548_15530 [Lachnospiraceae bacterium]|nr:hypothetical protein [Lachnospiraceae bacterium]